MPTSLPETPEHARRAERLLDALERVEIARLKFKSRKRKSKAFASIKQGLKQAIRRQKGRQTGGLKLHIPPQVDVKAVRERTGLTQEEFAATFAIGLAALRHWERGDRKPRGATLVLLNVIAKDPQAVLRAVEKA